MNRVPERPSGPVAPREFLAAGKRVAAAATVVTLLMVLAKGIVGYLRHSPALTADAVHSAADTLAIFASWVGLKLAEQPPTKRFPFGLYRAETLATLVASLVILVAGIGLLFESISGLVRGQGPAHHSLEVLLVAFASAVLSFGIFRCERRVGRQLNSQSLLANADESRTDIVTSLAVFAGSAATYWGLGSLELVVAMFLSLLIVWLGLKHGRVALYALLDASLDPQLECQVVSLAEQVPGVMKVEQARLRRAGPFCFGIAHIHLQRSTDVGRGHEVAHEVVRTVREAIPQIETLTVHLEPFVPQVQTVLVPADDNNSDADVSDHFGRAKFFALTTVPSAGAGEIEFIENTGRQRPARAGLAAVKQILDNRKVDAVLTREIGEIAFHTLRDRFVVVYAAPGGSVRNALAQFAETSVPRLAGPTHASEAAASPQSGQET